jgi:hypothetical protein
MIDLREQDQWLRRRHQQTVDRIQRQRTWVGAIVLAAIILTLVTGLAVPVLLASKLLILCNWLWKRWTRSSLQTKLVPMPSERHGPGMGSRRLPIRLGRLLARSLPRP